MFYRENGQFKTDYRADQQIFPVTQDRMAIGLIIAVPGALGFVITGLDLPGRPPWSLGFVSLLGLSFPGFALGPVLILIFAIMLGWLPVSGSAGAAYLVLPAITMGSALAAIITRMVRTAMLEGLAPDGGLFLPEQMFWYVVVLLLPVGAVAAWRMDIEATALFTAYTLPTAAALALTTNRGAGPCPAAYTRVPPAGAKPYPSKLARPVKSPAPFASGPGTAS